jgi:hypothetical protein
MTKAERIDARRESRKLQIIERREHITRMHAIEGFTPYVRALMSHQKRDIELVNKGR